MAEQQHTPRFSPEYSNLIQPWLTQPLDKDRLDQLLKGELHAGIEHDEIAVMRQLIMFLADEVMSERQYRETVLYQFATACQTADGYEIEGLPMSLKELLDQHAAGLL